jgi:class 3 adenylate cyclase/tetratricopeptide (TPR) repeat protein
MIPASRPAPADSLARYVPRLAVNWLEQRPVDTYRVIDGSMAFVDISGFTKLTERLARKGRVGAEEMSDILNATFGSLLRVARADGAELVKWGGDAVLLLFDGTDHAARAARSAVRMRRALREFTKLATSSGNVTLRMSVGIHSGEFLFFLVGDPQIHRELIVSGPTASRTAEMEAVADAGQIVVSSDTAHLLPAAVLGAAVDGGRVLRGEPRLDDLPPKLREPTAVDVGSVLPPHIRAHLLAATGESEHRPITVAFVQFSGTDALVQRTGPAGLAAALDECVRTVQSALATHEVTWFESDINRDGGKIMLTAGAPRSYGQDEERMLRAVQQIVSRAGTLPLRAGVNRGYVFAGDFGPEFRRTYSVKGDAINLAARVMGRAAPGQVLATRATIARSHTRFETEPLEPFLVKGKREPVHAVSVGPVIGAQSDADGEGRFVGRAAELRSLTAGLDAARSGAGRFVELVGEPGIGKSRLVRELRSHAGDLPVLEGASGAYDTGIAYVPFRALLRAGLGVAPDADAAAVAAALVERVRRAAPELLPWLPLVAIPLGVRLPDTSETGDLDEKFRKAKLEEVTLQALALLLPGPSLLIFDNCHLMDAASAELLHRLEAECGDRPWLVLALRRDQPSGFVPVADGAHEHRIELGPLDTQASMELLLRATQRRPLTRQTLAAIADRAGGNPLFLMALAVVAGQSGALPDLPESVEDVVTSQIDRLDPNDRALLRYAAVLGTRFAVPMLTGMLPDRPDIVADVRDGSAIARLGVFLRERQDGEWEFRHGLIRDVAYAGLPYRLRREMHDRVGAAIEESLAEPGTAAELLSLHFFHSGRLDKAWTYSCVAGRRAHSRYAYLAASEFLERAIDSAKRTPGLASAELVADVHEELGDVRALLGRTRGAIESYRGARANRRADPAGAAQLIFKEASIEQRLGRFSHSLGLMSRGLKLLDGVEGDRAAVARARLVTRYGFGRYLQGRSADAVRWCERGVHLAELTRDKGAMAMAYNALHVAYVQSGRGDATFGALAMLAYETLGDLAGQGHCANNLAIGAHRDGRWALADEMFGRAAETFGRIGDVANESNALYNRGDLLIRQGRFAEAEPLLDDVVRTARAVDDQELVALALRERARARVGLDRVAEAEPGFVEARSIFGALGLPQEILLIEAALAEAALRSGAVADALAAADAVLGSGGDLGAVLSVLHRVRAVALLELGRRDEAAAALDAAAVVVGLDDGGYGAAMVQRVELALGRLPEDRLAQLDEESSVVLAHLGVVEAADFSRSLSRTG